MVAAPLSYQSESARGPRPINLRKDIPQVMALLELVFRPTLEAEGKRVLNSLSLSQQPWLILRLRQWAEGIVPGFVWEEDGKIVGNVSLLSTGVDYRYLVANVAVHPNYRRQGIARMLMQVAIDLVERKGGREIMLQVKEENEAARRLYETLEFETIGGMGMYASRTSHIRQLPVPLSSRSPDRFGSILIRPLRSNEWREAWRLDQLSLAPDLNWPEPLARDAYRMGLFRWFGNLINGRHSETWVAVHDDGKMVGLATILSEWGRDHTLSLRVHPDWQEQVERPLLAKLLRRLHSLPRRNVRMEHPAGDRLAAGLLDEANFEEKRILTIMKRNL